MDNGLSDEIRRKIEALRLGLGANPGADLSAELGVAATQGAPEPDAGGGIDQIPDAREVVSAHGKCLTIERPIEACSGFESVEVGRILEAYRALARQIDEVRGDGARGECPAREGPRGKLAFLDLETTGLSATPLFLAGTLLVGEDGIRSLQLLARDYSEERCLIAALDSALKDHDVCITFNGKSFDLPYLRERAKYHRLKLEASPRQIDLLHHARRRWRRSLPNCRLLTLEWYILGRRRIGDVDGWEVPCIYHDFVHTKDARKLKHVLRHNLMDVFSMAQLLISLAEA